MAIIGDINAHTSTIFSDEVLYFYDRFELVISDVIILTCDLFMHVSEAHATTSWLGHAICSKDMHTLISILFSFQIRLPLPITYH